MAMVFGFLSLSIVAAFADNAPAPAEPALQSKASDEVEAAGLPALGKWMIDENGNVAHWLGYRLDGKVIDEPINVIMRIEANSPEEAENRLIESAQNAGFEVRKGHTSGYRANLNHELRGQYPATAEHAFSDGYYLMDNDHGRIFGPLAWEGRYIFVAALSREDVALMQKLLSYVEGKYFLLHPYASFRQARDKFVNGMCGAGGAKYLGPVDLGNKISSDVETTGDHDGMAILLDL